MEDGGEPTLAARETAPAPVPGLSAPPASACPPWPPQAVRATLRDHLGLVAPRPRTEAGRG
ncbi:hypothetical protein GCM10010295_39240 [Streptomyces intermedius]